MKKDSPKQSRNDEEKSINVFMLEYMHRLCRQRLPPAEFAHTLSELGRLEQYLHDGGMSRMRSVTMVMIENYGQVLCDDCQAMKRLKGFVRYAKRAGMLRNNAAVRRREEK